MKEITEEQLENCGESFVTFHFSADKKTTERMLADLDNALLKGIKHWALARDGLHVCLNDEKDYCVNWAKGFLSGWLVGQKL